MPAEQMLLDPVTCLWDRPEEGVYEGGIRIYKKDKAGNLLWARKATQEETLYLAQYEQLYSLNSGIQCVHEIVQAWWQSR